MEELGEKEYKTEGLGEGYETGTSIREEEPTDEEIDLQISKLKRRKAKGEDGIKNEAWIFGRGKIRTRLREVIREVRRGEYSVEDWREGLIAPIYKKGEKENIKNYSGVTLTYRAYKLYASILNERIMKSVEEKGGYEDNQAGFRKKRGCYGQRLHFEKDDRKDRKGKRGKSICSVPRPERSIRQFGQKDSVKSDGKDRNRKWIGIEMEIKKITIREYSGKYSVVWRRNLGMDGKEGAGKLAEAVW
ncbi:uncharacterized protein LOC123265021 [Cotesia glomerata]|uniref:uncharacterized protein LOC123265021 n=1 Tax=Cotesia glomerata TaxID=32391 RepID=UPI001D034B21|nr:uncharacterized protein LOC123265021 [Cotesia glomerata]